MKKIPPNPSMVISQHDHLYLAKHCTTVTIVTRESIKIVINGCSKPQVSLRSTWASYYFGEVRKLAV